MREAESKSQLQNAAIYLNGNRIGELESFEYTLKSAEVRLASLTLEPEPFLGTISTTIEFDCVVSPGAWRWLATGRRRPPRAETKRRNRERQEVRRALVHAAGCSYRYAATHCSHRPAGRADSTSKAVSVPRSLRGRFGRYVAMWRRP